MNSIDNVKHLTIQELEAGLGEILQSPKDRGTLEMIVCRPQVGEREVLEEGALDLHEGLVGDNWITRGSKHTADGSSNPEMQLNIINARVIGLLAQDKERWQLAGDQLFIDMDLSARNLPPGTRLAIGTAVIEVTAQPHTGCRKFMARFGEEALKFISTPLGRELHMRGINAKVVRTGTISTGDVVKKVESRESVP